MQKIAVLADPDSSHVFKWVNAISDEFQILLIGYSRIEKLDYSCINNVEVKRLPYTSPLSYFTSNRSIKMLVKKFSPDLLHAHYATSYGMIGRLVNLKPYVLSVWGSDIYEFPKKSFLHKYLLKRNLSSPNLVLSSGEQMKTETSLYSSRAIDVIPFGIDVDKFKYNSTKSNSETYVIGCVKHFEKVYNHISLVKAFSNILKSSNLNLRLLLIGDGRELEPIKELVRKLEITEYVEFKGFVPNSQLPQLFEKIDLLVIPSLRESFGVSVLEGMASGIPVLASDISGFNEVGTSETISFFDPNSVDDLQKKIHFSINNYDLVLKKSEKARKRVEKKFNWDDCVAKQKQIYRSLITE